MRHVVVDISAHKQLHICDCAVAAVVVVSSFFGLEQPLINFSAVVERRCRHPIQKGILIEGPGLLTEHFLALGLRPGII